MMNSHFLLSTHLGGSLSEPGLGGVGDCERGGGDGDEDALLDGPAGVPEELDWTFLLVTLPLP